MDEGISKTMQVTQRNAAVLLFEAVECNEGVVKVAAAVDEAASLVLAVMKAGRKVFFCGNGGSAADAQHLAAEFLGRYLMERDPLPAIALTVNSSTVTAIGNDYGYEQIFSRQLRGLAVAGDVLIGLSTSGDSPNVIEAFRAASALGVRTISMTGEKESILSHVADLSIRVPSTHTPRVQEMHIMIGHTICEIVEAAMTDNGG